MEKRFKTLLCQPFYKLNILLELQEARYLLMCMTMQLYKQVA